MGPLAVAAKEMGVSLSTTYRRLRAAGLYPKPRLIIPRAELARLYCEEHKSSKEIAKHFHCDSTVIRDRLRFYGIPLRSQKEAMKLVSDKTRRQGSKHGKWKGGRRLNANGYIIIYKPDHPRAIRNFVLEHIVIWEESHAHPLPQGWIIHHLNGVKADNRRENLIATPSRHHADFIRALQQRIKELEEAKLWQPS